jgi:hypothetical protein
MSSRFDRKLTTALVLLTCAMTSAFVPAALAQSNSQTPKKKQNFDKADMLKEKVSIAGLPEYSGKQKFLFGMYHKTEIGPQYSEQFLAMEQATQVVDWYKSALSSYKWEILNSDATRVMAKKPDGSSISIIADPCKSKEGRTIVKINYHDYHIKNNDQ